MQTLSSRWRSASLRSQLMVLTGVLLALSILVTSFVAISVLRTSMLNGIDGELRDSVRTVSAVLVADLQGEEGVQVPHAGYLLDAEGAVVAEAVNTPDGVHTLRPDLSRIDLEHVEENPLEAATVGSVGAPDRTWRVVTAKPQRLDLVVAVAEPLDDTNAMLSAVTLLTLSFGVATLFAAMAVGWVLVTRAFAPLHHVEQTAARIAEGDLSQRMEGYNRQTEIGQLSASLNTMLGHIEDAFEARTRSEGKLRRFVADASHELRTPLVTIRGYSELYRHGALQKPEDVGSAMARIESEAKRMTQLVEDLLMLARLDERRPAENVDVDLLHLAFDAAGDAHASDPDRRIEVVGLQGAGPVSAWVHGDESRLRQVVANLVTNALRYTPDGSPIEIAVGVERSVDETFNAVLQVRDHGPGIHGPDAERVFERFYRADSSRTRETGGTGLGLSIVAAIVQQHDGTVRLTETPGGGATMTVRVPGIERADDAPEV
ncbi:MULTISPECIES: HAMP domain-containing sensor histidine kinase [Kocuria]|uniref:histidine kinase n=1 Tax=Kocuria oceani TaxID=988827 RepID=A0ABV9TET9_9MICC|nr:MULTISPECIES: HAMP domain-containing sensor histidine kinase [Kocuria]KLU11037.1 histidine kinase [Kocuria sp. SM24M-10]